MLTSAIIVSVGMLVTVDWKLEPDYHNCVGILQRIEEVPGFGPQHTMTVIRDMKCPNGSKKEWVGTVVGIRATHLKPASDRDRSWYGK